MAQKRETPLSTLIRKILLQKSVHRTHRVERIPPLAMSASFVKEIVRWSKNVSVFLTSLENHVGLWYVSSHYVAVVFADTMDHVKPNPAVRMVVSSDIMRYCTTIKNSNRQLLRHHRPLRQKHPRLQAIRKLLQLELAHQCMVVIRIKPNRAMYCSVIFQ